VLLDTEPWLKLSHGAKVKIKGTLPESDEWVGTPGALILCEVVEAAPHQLLKVSAEQLGKEYAANADAAAEKYHDKHALVDGEVAKTGTDMYEVELKGTTPVVCSFNLRFKDPIKRLKPGQKVEVYGQIESKGSLRVSGESLSVK
jgi:hypothetical protein